MRSRPWHVPGKQTGDFIRPEFANLRESVIHEGLNPSPVFGSAVIPFLLFNSIEGNPRRLAFPYLSPIAHFLEKSRYSIRELLSHKI